MHRRCAENAWPGDVRAARGRHGFAHFVPVLVAIVMSACTSAPPVSPQPAEADSTADAAEGQAATAGAPEPLPPEAVQQFEQAMAQMSAGNEAAAEQALRSLASAYPTYSGPLLNLGILHAKAGRLEQAEQALREAIERNPGNAIAFNQLGIVYRRLGRFGEADAAYQRALEIDPNYALAYLNLGVLCDLYLQQPQRALEAYERYLSLAASPDARVSQWLSELKKRQG